MSFAPTWSGPTGHTNIQDQRERWEKKHSLTAVELLQSERSYCQQLELVTTFFVKLLMAKGTLKKDIKERIFSSIEAIYSVNQSLLVNLENGFLGRGFDQFCSQLHHYCTYADNIYTADNVLRIQLRKNKAFRRFKKLQESRLEFNNHKLEDLLQLPIQRIDQYKHFLHDLAANMSPNNLEFEQMSRAATTVGGVSQRIQNNARHHDNHLQLCRVQKMMRGQKTKVLAKGRWYVREGWLNVVPPKGTGTKPKMFFLFSDMLLQAKRCSSLLPTSGGSFVGQCAYPLLDCTVEKVFGHTRSQGGLLSLNFPKAKLLLMSSSQENISDWYHSLSATISKLQSKTGPPESGVLTSVPLRVQ
ncbi:rho guanine nucleotide exchange factor 39 [Takifugu rubripes]|uniref:rho guanine nucleotide exchange factor 39 n=1 Tax=Takifugu rubripes TaxID=31033 RepID=UPI0011459B74|nr:rho guanine nucleotide exchange factor 39 [Takifugu rubripes]XP_029681524.1 rho guanine nucleotide exchange factor 39 [Takifugu rubripes]XP_029681525.1 rho guanine nucleotide exchange factor 39 [Takifugu rubripes]XP_029681526.1 rho guanine nucleotide exchange factor 39 [Takifugu rubripes]